MYAVAGFKWTHFKLLAFIPNWSCFLQYDPQASEENASHVAIRPEHAL